MTPRRVLDRALARFERAGGCHISTYSTGNHGYAQVGWSTGGKVSVVLAHRAAWEAVNGPIPTSLTVDHICFERRCVNPAHLRLVTREVNAAQQGRTWPRVRGECGHMVSQYSHEGSKPWCKRCWRAKAQLAQMDSVAS